jgi:cell division protein FtsL
MSTTFDLRGATAPQHAAETPVIARPAPATPRRAAQRRPVAGQAAGQTRRAATINPLVAVRTGIVAAQRLALRSGRAGFFAVVILALSVLGLIYITQISHVASYGYRLSALQQQQAKLDRENQLLQYKIDAERTLNRANDIAVTNYKMQELAGAAKPLGAVTAVPQASTTATASSPKLAAPQIRFVTAQRPRVTPATAATAATPLTLLDRLWNRIVGVGVARAAEQ